MDVMKSYTVTKDADMMAPSWLTTRINYTTIKFVYRIIDGHETLNAVGISIMPAWTLSQERLIIIQFSGG